MYYVEIFSTAFYFNNLEVHMYSASQSGKVFISSIPVSVYNSYNFQFIIPN